MQNGKIDRKVGPSALGITAKCDVGMLGRAVNCGEGRGRGDSGDKRHRAHQGQRGSGSSDQLPTSFCFIDNAKYLITWQVSALF